LKYAYVGNGAIRFLRVLKSPEYYTYRNEVNMINNHAHKIKNNFEDNVIVLGVGNGEKLNKILGDLNEEYVTLVDISEILLKKGLEFLKRNFNVENTSFEKLKLNDFSKKTSFVLFGGTLANMKNWDQFLLKLKKNFPKQNIFLGLEFADMSKPKIIKKIIKEYDNETGFKFIFYPLSILGFSRHDGHIEVGFNYRKSRIEEYFILNSSGIKKARRLKLLNSKKILLSISIKLERNQFLKKIKKIGLKNGLEFNNNNNSIIELKF
jgi:hypothetical protein